MARRRRFGETWWGRAWIDALEGRARLDPNRLPRGRTYARQGQAQAIDLEPGRITARVQGRRAQPYRVEVRVREFSAEEWRRVLAVIASRVAHAAALLDGELDPGIDDDAREAGVELLPDTGEIQPRCSCPDWADPCKHSAAVCYLVADELDADPFLLLRLRGRDRDQVLAGVRAARAAATGDDSPNRPPATLTPAAPATIRAVDAFATLPAPEREIPEPSLASSPVEPAPWPIDAPAGSGLAGEQLRQLAADAAQRAWAVLRQDAPSGLRLNPTHDLARRAADALGSPRFEELAARAKLGSRALARLAIAWREAQGPGVDALEAPPWRPSPEPMIAARQALDEAGMAMTKVKVDHNRVTVAGQFQLRYGTDHRWYRFEKHSGAWELTAPAVDDPADLL